RRRHTRFSRDWSSDVCSSDLVVGEIEGVTTCVVVDPEDVAGTSSSKVQLCAVQEQSRLAVIERYQLYAWMGYRCGPWRVIGIRQIGRASCRERGQEVKKERRT